MEYWLIFDVASGEVLMRGSGSVGLASLQTVPEGAALVVVPFAVVAQPQLDLEALRDDLLIRVDGEAEVIRMRFLTPGAGQALTYQRKEAEARAWLADDSVATAFLSTEATARAVTVAQVAAEVITAADLWLEIGAEIEALRMKAKSSLGAATTLGEMMAAVAIDWEALAGPGGGA